MAKKNIKTTEGPEIALTNPFIERRFSEIKNRIKIRFAADIRIIRINRNVFEFYLEDVSSKMGASFSISYNSKTKELNCITAMEEFTIHSSQHSVYFDMMKMITNMEFVSLIRDSIEEILKRD